MGHRNKKMGDFVKKIMNNPPPEFIAKTDKTTHIVPGADQFNTESASFDIPYYRSTRHQGTASQKAAANAENRESWNIHMNSAKGNFSAAGDTLKNKGTYCTECNKFHED
jgi:hypothetical protein